MRRRTWRAVGVSNKGFIRKTQFRPGEALVRYPSVVHDGGMNSCLRAGVEKVVVKVLKRDKNRGT